LVAAASGDDPNRTNKGESSKKSLPALNDVGNKSTNHEGQ
jgi:hypothetical protein